MKQLKPKPVAQPDFQNLIELCQDELNQIAKRDVDDDMEQYIYEAAMEAVFGEDVWDYINDKLE